MVPSEPTCKQTPIGLDELPIDLVSLAVGDLGPGQNGVMLANFAPISQVIEEPLSTVKFEEARPTMCDIFGNVQSHGI